MKTDALVVGAGFSGAVVAQQLADRGMHVLVIDKRDHIGGNAHDRHDAHGVLIHPYGPHIFHTNSARIFQYLSQFTRWRPYEHRVLAKVDDKLVPIPINIDTVNRLYGLALTEETIFDDRTGRIVNASLAEYHVPVQADVPFIDVVYTDLPDPHTPLGAHGIGEIGITGVAAAIANAVYHATGRRITDLPITLDKLL